MAIVLLRHGQATKAADGPLTPKGEREAATVARSLADVPVQEILSAPEDRTRETAAKWSATSGVPMRVVPEMAAWDLGRFRGDHSKASNTVVDTLLAHPQRKPPGGGESAREYWSRFLPAVLPLIAAKETYGVVGHSRGIKSIEALVRGNGTMNHDVWKEPLLKPGGAVLVSREGWEPLEGS